MVFTTEECINCCTGDAKADTAETTNQSNKVPFNEGKNCSRPNPDIIRNFFLITYKQSLLF